MKFKPINIIGGGLAGLTLGLGLRRRDLPVTVWEAGHYPRHRVCGEFICGRGQAVLEALGVRGLLLGAGAILARDAVFVFGNSSLPPRAVEPPALCLSRYKLDALLADQFVSAGGVLRENTPHRGDVLAEGMVRASGRRAQAVAGGWRWFGLKIHARGVRLLADLEMHCLSNQYVGLGRIEEDKVNICGLFRRRAGALNTPCAARDLLLGPAGSSLRHRLENAVLDESSFCSVAGLSLRPQRAGCRDECCIGDALTMIPPVTGNGMSMAFEAAAAALVPLEAYSRNAASWEEARRNIARACDRLFRRRLRYGTWLQQVMFCRCLQGKTCQALLRSKGLWRFFFVRTR